MNNIYDNFCRIQKYYKDKEIEGIKRGIFPVKKTEKGLWGVSDMLDLFTFFSRMNLQRYNHFLDLGSGDGRIVLIASLFTEATGIEYDKELFTISESAKKDLGIKNAYFKNTDYMTEDISRYDVMFIYADHPFGKEFEEKILKEFKSVLLVYGTIFTPEHLKKGRTYHVNMSNIVSYHINKEEANIYE